MNKKYYEDKNKNAYEVKTPLEKLMWKEIGEMWEELLPKIEERDKYKEIIDKARKYIKEHSTTIDYKTMKADYNLNMNDLLDILEGDNK